MEFPQLNSYAKKDLILIIALLLYKIMDLRCKILTINPYIPKTDAKSNKGSRIYDACFKVKLKNGENAYIFLEKQARNDSKMPVRMHQIILRLSDRENSFNVYGVYICAGKIVKKVLPNSFYNSFLDTECTTTYKTYTVCQADENELINDDRPFSIAILAIKYQIEAGKDPYKRGELAVKLVRLLRSKHLSPKDYFVYYAFINDYLRMDDNDISPAHKKEFKMELKQSDQLINETIARVAKKQGEEIGIEKGLLTAAKALHDTGMSISEIADRLKLDQGKVKKHLRAS